MGIRNKFVSLITDVGGPTYIQPTHWNSPLNAPQFRAYDWDPGISLASFATPSTAGPTGFEFFNNADSGQRGLFDFSFVDSMIMGVGMGSINSGLATGGGGSTALRFQYMASGFPGSWYSFDATGGSAPFISLATAHNASLYLASANGLRFSASTTISAAAKALPQPLTTRMAAYGGNGSAALLGKIVVFVI